MASRPSSRIIDVLLLLMAISTVTTADLAFAYRSNLMVLLCFAAVLGSVTYFSVLPWIRSRPLTATEREKIGLPEGVRIRVSQSDGFRAIDLIFRRCVVIPYRILESTRPEYRFQVIHEAGHLQNRDPLFFHYIFPAVLAAALYSGFIGLLDPGILFRDAFSALVPNSQNLPKYAQMIAVVLGLGFPLITFSLAALTLHDREFSADHLAYKKAGDAYRDHLKLQARLARHRRPANILVWLWNRLTHPTYRRRLKSLDLDQSMLTRPGIILGVTFTLLVTLQAYNMIVGGLLDAVVNVTEVRNKTSDISNTEIMMAFLPFILVFLSYFSLSAWLSLAAANSARNDRSIRKIHSAAITVIVLAFAPSIIGYAALLLIPGPFSDNTLLVDPRLIAGYDSAIAFAGFFVIWNLFSHVLSKVTFNFLVHLTLGTAVSICLFVTM